jgi:hypothetical protein
MTDRVYFGDVVHRPEQTIIFVVVRQARTMNDILIVAPEKIHPTKKPAAKKLQALKILL